MTHCCWRMLKELQRRNDSAGTVRLYLQQVAVFAQHLHRPSHQIGADKISWHRAF